MRTFSKDLQLSLIIGGIFLALICGYFLGTYIQKYKYAGFIKSFRNLRDTSDNYKFINPLVSGVSAPATDVGVFEDVQKEISSYLRKEKSKGNLYDYSFYFRDMNTGLWFGDHESTSFFPASLFKLPIAIAVYKQGEKDPSFLKKQVIYTKEISDLNKVTQLNAESSLVVGRAYSVEELVYKMLTLSDNGAKDTLLSSLDTTYLNNLFHLAILAEPMATQVYEISSRKYSLFLRMLYGSSYLNEEHSELLLNLLSQSTFKDGLVAGIPEHITIAHKFGVYQFSEIVKGKEFPSVQLHDCGIIYHIAKPYIICFMTKGKDEAVLFRIISHISKMVYDYQDNND